MGDAYPPSFIVDNNEMLWGGMRENVGIRPPSVLLEDKEHPPFVLICNMYHASIEKQLDAMGIRWRRYDDKYFFRYQNLVEKGSRRMLKIGVQSKGILDSELLDLEASLNGLKAGFDCIDLNLDVFLKNSELYQGDGTAF